MKQFKKRMLKLAYQLGEIHLFNLNMSLYVYCQKTFLSEDAIDAVSELPCLAENKALEANGYFYPSYPINSPLPKLQFAVKEGNIYYIPYQYKRFYVDLTGSFDEYKKKFLGKTQNTLQRKIRKFTELSGGKIDFKVYRKPEEIKQLYAFAKKISAMTYQERLLHVGIPKTKAFEKKMNLMAKNDQVRGYLLFYNQTPISYVFCFCHEDIVEYSYVGYDPQFQKYSVGIILQYLLLDNLFTENKFSLFDFTQGEGAHKALFSTDYINCADIYVLNFSFRNCITVCSHSCITSISSLIVRLLTAMRLSYFVKKMIRRGIAK